MAMRYLGALVFIFSLAMLCFSVMACLELHNAATSEVAPSAESMPLVKIVGPELFDAHEGIVKPADLANTIFNRIYVLGGGALLLAIVGGVLLVAPTLRQKNQTNSQ